MQEEMISVELTHDDLNLTIQALSQATVQVSKAMPAVSLLNHYVTALEKLLAHVSDEDKNYAKLKNDYNPDSEPQGPEATDPEAGDRGEVFAPDSEPAN